MRYSKPGIGAAMLAFLICTHCNRSASAFAEVPDLNAMIQSASRQKQEQSRSQLAKHTNKSGASVVTITRVITLDAQHSTPTLPHSGEAGTKPIPKVKAGESGHKSPPTDLHSRTWISIFAAPMYVVTTLTSTSFSYVAYPMWTASFWAIRMLLFRPAVFVYLLLLERPLQALTSVFFWILPTLVFAIVATLLGTLIGGTSGWISAVTTNFFNPPAKQDRRVATEKSYNRSISEPARKTIARSEKRKTISTPKPATAMASELQSRPKTWSRRRSTENKSIPPPMVLSRTKHGS